MLRKIVSESACDRHDISIYWMIWELTAHLNRADQGDQRAGGNLGKTDGGRNRVTEQLKMQDLMKWVGLMNNIKACAGRNCAEREYIYM